MTAIPSSTVRLAAVGDLLITTRPGTHRPGRGLEALSGEILRLFASCDIVLANLECTLPAKESVITEPRLFTSEAQIISLSKVGVNMVSLANNHAFDGGDEGFKKLTDLLKRQNIAWFGAGLDLAAAGRPHILDIKGIRIAVTGAVDASSGMHRFAGPASSGVPMLDRESLCRQINTLSKDTNYIIVSPHWGEERFRFPSPEQIEQAHAFIDAGAAIVLGHHPHVVQGMEFYKNHPLVYSLGNFIANHVYWESGDYLTWNRFERTGCIFLAELYEGEVKNAEQIPVFDDGKTISIDTAAKGKRYLNKANRMLAQKATPGRYRREGVRVRTLLPILSQMRWEELRRVKASRLHKALKLFSNRKNNPHP